MAILKIKDGDEWKEIEAIQGPEGPEGNGIASITKTGTSGLVDTYTVLFDDGTTTTFDVTNGEKGDKGEDGEPGATGNGIASVEKTGTSGLVDTYTITFTNGTTTTFTVTNGSDATAEWGNITGTLADQTDLKNALDNKADISSLPSKTSDLTNDSGFITSSSLPTKVSDLTNDSGFITSTVDNLTNYYTKTSTYTKSEVDNLIGAVSSLNIEVVQELPSQDISTSTIYLVPKTTSETNDVYDEYIYVSNSWEHIGSTDVDLSGYQTKIDASHKLSADLVDDTSTTNKFVTSSEKTTWDGKQNALVSGTNIKTINNESLLGSGNISVSANSSWGSITGTLSNQTDLNTALTGKQSKFWEGTKAQYDAIATKDPDTYYAITDDADMTTYQPLLVSGTNIKTINNTSILGSGNISAVSSTDITTISKLTQSQYDALTTKDSNTLYIIVG